MRANAARALAVWSAVLATVAIAYGGCSPRGLPRASSHPSARATEPIPAGPATASGTAVAGGTEGDNDDNATGDDDDENGGGGDGDGGGDNAPQAPVDPSPIARSGNARIPRFDEAKRALSRIYAEGGHRIDLYCGCSFRGDGHTGPTAHGLRVDLASCGFVPARDRARAERIEWEHAVPASAFGHTFAAWREGDPRCITRGGKRFRGRKCARLASKEFSRIEADLHNLFPVVGEVNGLRADLPMGVLDPPGRPSAHAPPGTGQAPREAPSFAFGRCTSAIEKGVFLPRREVRGDLARAYKYMHRNYPERRLIDEAHRAVFDRWDREDPPDLWERERNRRIEAVQGNANEFIDERREK